MAKAREVLLLDPGNYTPYYDINLGHALAQRGWKVEWLTSRYLFEPVPVPETIQVRIEFFRRLERLRPSPFLRRAVKALSYPLELLRLDAELRTRPPGLLHVQWALWPDLDARLWRRWQQRGWTVVYTAHDVTPLSGTTPRLLGRSYSRLFQIPDAVVVHSQAEARELQRFAVPAQRVHPVPQGGPGLFFGDPPAAQDARAALGLAPDRRPILLFFGLLKPYKGIGVLLRSLACLREAHPRILLLVAGEPMMRRGAWARTVRELGIDAHVEWRNGYVPSEQVRLHFAAADVVVLPYLRGSSSAVLLNAYAHSRPVVATRVGGLPEMVEPGVSGQLVPPGDAGALADTLRGLLAEPEALAAMGRRARQLLEERHGWTAIAQRTEAIYDERHPSR